uniref:Uncharacterized protein n=1 Tax=Entomoneis paludosa TaxID=265537 RepID=A0A7S3DT99_9STRA|mmetsp:Transcript_34487/g.71823  ORF Transcript_34487/g.71823 Transcript_34487/m.71823 type:complete len:126 (+) Transcript_34487:287-664(+)
MIRKSSQNLVSDPVRIFKVFFLLAWSEETSLSVHHCPLLYEKAITASLTTRHSEKSARSRSGSSGHSLPIKGTKDDSDKNVESFFVRFSGFSAFLIHSTDVPGRLKQQWQGHRKCYFRIAASPLS